MLESEIEDQTEWPEEFNEPFIKVYWVNSETKELYSVFLDESELVSLAEESNKVSQLSSLCQHFATTTLADAILKIV